jgi:hypothetical protein
MEPLPSLLTVMEVKRFSPSEIQELGYQGMSWPISLIDSTDAIAVDLKLASVWGSAWSWRSPAPTVVMSLSPAYRAKAVSSQ